MDLLTLILTIIGLALFEIISSIDNSVINAEVLSSMQPKARKWFLLWGFLFAVLFIRGFLPWLIIWVTSPELGPIGSLTATFSTNPKISESIAASSPILLAGGGIFLTFLFFHWLFMEPKIYGLKGERFFHSQSVWFYALASLLLLIVTALAIQKNPLMALGAVVGSTAFFITHGFKQNAQESEQKLIHRTSSDLSKLLYLEVIDATFSIDGVLGAFAFTLSVPIILLGNGLGAFVVRQLTISNINKIKKYVFLKNGAMYSVLFLGVIMLLDSFGIKIPSWLSPLVTFLTVGYFFYKSYRVRKTSTVPQIST